MVLVFVSRDWAPPPGYSYVWRDWNTDAWVCAPVPLNFVLWQLPWRYSAVMRGLVNRGVIILEEGDYYRNALIEWRPWRWQGRRFAR